MVTDLSEHVESLHREITPFEQVEDSLSQADQLKLTHYLVDGFWEARLDGFMDGYVVGSSGQVDPALPREKVALCVIYAGIRILRLQLVNTEAHFRATAGPVGFESRVSATVMAEMLRQLEARKQQLLEALESTDAYVLDALTTRTLSVGSYGGWVN